MEYYTWCLWLLFRSVVIVIASINYLNVGDISIYAKLLSIKILLNIVKKYNKFKYSKYYLRHIDM